MQYSLVVVISNELRNLARIWGGGHWHVGFDEGEMSAWCRAALRIYLARNHKLVSLIPERRAAGDDQEGSEYRQLSSALGR